MEKIKLWQNDKIPFFSKTLNTQNNTNTPYITPFIINDKKKRPAMIIIPGGGYTHRAEHEGAPIAKWLNDRGINSFVVDYRVAPYSYPVPLIDVKRAVKYVRFHAEKFMIHPDKIGIMGFSAGAHTACCAAEYFDDMEYEPEDDIDKTSGKLNLCVLCYPVITMKEEFCHIGSKERITGGNKELEKKLSCEDNVRSDMPPTFIWHTFEDKSVPVRNSLELAVSLKEKEVPFELHIYPEGRHGLGITKCTDIEGVNKWTESFENWLNRNNFI